MNSVDFDKLGFKSGVEIHQQILTEKKMFCNCPAGLYSETHDAELLRHMRPTLSEMGTYDGTALMEFKTKKNVVYRINKESVCTYELDDTPPFPVNQKALDIAIEIALLLNCQLVDEMFITRKQYLDGSIPAGFQRTAIVGVDGWIPYKGRKIGIIQLGFEEDSCREISDEGHTIIFRTDRLSMPLIEVVTQPDMKTPQEVADVIRVIGRLLKATGKIRRGIGSVRQDVNVSIDGSTRVEIKGVPRIGYVPALVYNEAYRQKALVTIRDELAARNLTEADFDPQTADLTEQFRRSGCQPLREAVAAGATVRGIRLAGFKDILSRPTQPGVTFAREFADRVRVVACIDSAPILFHTDAFPSEAGPEERANLLKAVGADEEKDVAVITWGDRVDTETAAEEIRLRALEALLGVPGETRQRLDGGLTGFERVLPGADRMYPDTDSPPTKIAADRVEAIRARLPERPWDREARYATLGLPDGLRQALAISPYAPLFDRVIENQKINVTLVAVTLLETLKALRREGVAIAQIAEASLEALFADVANSLLVRRQIPNRLRRLALGQDASEPTPPSEKDVKQCINSVLDENAFHGESSHKAMDYYVGKVLRQLPASACGRMVADLVRKGINHKERQET